MKYLLITLTILATARATPFITKTDIETPVASIANNEKLKVAMTKAIEANNQLLESKGVEESLLFLLKSLNISGISTEPPGLNDSVDVAVETSKIAECIYEGVKTFILCELNAAKELEDLTEIFPFIKCASTAAVDAAHCFFRNPSLLQFLRDDIATNNHTNEIYKTFRNTMMKMLQDDAGLNVNELIGIDYYFDWDTNVTETY